MPHIDVVQIVIVIVAVLFSAILHECSHGYVAYLLGDDTAYAMGRLTLNPLAHIDPFMTILLPLILYLTTGFVFGGAKPVPINPYNFKNPAKGFMISSIAGPLTNLILATAGALFSMVVYRISGPQSYDRFFIDIWVLINLLLMVFNLIPIPPLDGSRVIRYFLPFKGREFMDRYLEPYGLILIMILWFAGILNIVLPVMNFFIHLFHYFNPNLLVGLM